MNYTETIQYLYNSTPMFQNIGAAAYKEGLDNTIALDNHLGNPHRKFKTIHVAGTNGKGSCSHTIAAILQSEGYRVGLYTSPHLVSFRERIRVNGHCITEDEVVRFVAMNKDFFEPLHPSFFELTTAMAFNHFAGQEVDIAVIEVGLGGRLDCTNIISPLLSVITNISKDHTQFLGNTLADIAREKAGIIKPHTPVVVGEWVEETRPVFEAKAKEMGASIVFAQDCPEVTKAERSLKGGLCYTTRSYGEVYGELGGLCQANNANTVLTAINILKAMGLVKSDSSVAEGMANVCKLTGLMGRWQKIGEQPTVVCDTGHNTGGWQYISQQLKGQQCDRMHIVFGMVDDKDIDSVMDMLPRNATFYFCKAETKRAISEQQVRDHARRHGLDGMCFATVKEAYNTAMASAKADDFVFVGGSSYVVADLMTHCITSKHP